MAELTARQQGKVNELIHRKCRGEWFNRALRECDDAAVLESAASVPGLDPQKQAALLRRAGQLGVQT